MTQPHSPEHDFPHDEILPSRKSSGSYELSPAMVREIQRFARFEDVPFQEALKSCLLVGIDYWNDGRIPGEPRGVEDSGFPRSSP